MPFLLFFDPQIADAKKHYLGGEDRKPIITVQDVIGPKPCEETNPEIAKAFAALDAMIGLDDAKKEMRQLLDWARSNWDKEYNGEDVDHVALNRVLVGNPGTGTCFSVR